MISFDFLHIILLQVSYIRFDNVTFTRDKNYAEVNFSCRVSPDGAKSFLTQNVTFLVDILDERQTITVTAKNDESDDKYSLKVLKTAVTTCKIAKGTLPTIANRIFMTNFAKSARFNVSCSYPKNTPLIIDDLLIDDFLLPPMLTEKQFKIHTRFFSKIKKSRGYPFIYDYTIYGRYKK